MTLILQDVTLHHIEQALIEAPFCLRIESNQIVTLMGVSGCGKSSLLSFISGHMAAGLRHTGDIFLAEHCITRLPPHQRTIGLVLQKPVLFPHLTVWQNLAFALPNHIRGVQRKRQAIQTLEEIGLTNLANRWPHEISGGQQARCALVRALLAQPKALLLDEPFGQLDEKTHSDFRQWTFHMVQQQGIPTLMVTHDINDTAPQQPLYHFTNGRIQLLTD